jgi:hypothetical protein
LVRLADSAKIFEEVLPVFEQRYGADSLRTADILKHYALVLKREGRRDEAKKIEVRAGRIFAEYAVLASSQPIDVLQLPPRHRSDSNNSMNFAKRYQKRRQIFV